MCRLISLCHYGGYKREMCITSHFAFDAKFLIWKIFKFWSLSLWPVPRTTTMGSHFLKVRGSTLVFSPKAHGFWRWHWLSQWYWGRKGSKFGTLRNWNTNCISTEKGCWTFSESGQPRASLFCAYSILSDAVWYGLLPQFRYFWWIFAYRPQTTLSWNSWICRYFVGGNFLYLALSVVLKELC